MNKEVISDKQAIMMIILFVMGSAIVVVPGLQAKKDVWLASIIAVAWAFPVVLVYSRMLSLFPGQDLFDILRQVFGKIPGSIISLLYIWFALHLGALVLNNFGTFIMTVGLRSTPMIVPMACLAFLCAWAVKEGIEVLGKWSAFFLPILGLVLMASSALLIPRMEIKEILPVLYDGIRPVLMGAADLFSFPYGEVVVFLMVFYCLKSGKSSYKVYTSALAISGFLGTMVTMSVVLILGAEYASTTYYPSYMAEMRMNIAGFLERLEIIVSIGFLAAGFVKISICLLAACNGLSKVLGFKNYRFLVIPVALLMLNLAYLIYPNIMESYKWVTKVWIYYAFPFQVVLPFIIWIGCEIKARISRKAS